MNPKRRKTGCICLCLQLYWRTNFSSLGKWLWLWSWNTGCGFFLLKYNTLLFFIQVCVKFLLSCKAVSLVSTTAAHPFKSVYKQKSMTNCYYCMLWCLRICVSLVFSIISMSWMVLGMLTVTNGCFIEAVTTITCKAATATVQLCFVLTLFYVKSWLTNALLCSLYVQY